MSDHSNGNGETDEERVWREHGERFDAVRALERRLGSLETAIRLGFDDVRAKLDKVLDHVKDQRGDVTDLYKRWTQLIDLQLNTEKRVAALETKPRAKRRK